MQRKGQSVDGRPWIVAMKRVNKLATVLAKFDMTGSWEEEMRDGSKLIADTAKALTVELFLVERRLSSRMDPRKKWQDT